ncbi:MAG: hypothetical protein EOP56_09300 [Sphingobacteriales bacterium]|nr:MAG: hypothetical protein EOP56_09300 [Sphingobacteriales bacterium]
MTQEERKVLAVLKKAFRCTYTWADNHDGDLYWASDVSQAKRDFFQRSEGEKEDFLCIRAKRAPDFDLLENPNPHPLLNELSDKQKGKMEHAIGHDYYKDEPYRNRYVCENDDDMECLISKGLAHKGSRLLDSNVYWLTELGIAVIKSAHPIYRMNLQNNIK